MAVYYLDTCIWRDYYENRIGYNGYTYGEYASTLLLTIIYRKGTIILSDCVIFELKKAYCDEVIEQMFTLLHRLCILKKVLCTKKDWLEAFELSQQKEVGTSDTLHAILARNNKALLVTQNIKDFKHFSDMIMVKRPQDII
ncbi:MAG: PIN domain-containing protein [Candidatus Woesearchaeota archaeon]